MSVFCNGGHGWRLGHPKCAGGRGDNLGAKREVRLKAELGDAHNGGFGKRAVNSRDPLDFGAEACFF